MIVKFTWMLFLLIFSEISLAQKRIVLDSNSVKVYEYYDNTQTKVKKEYFYDGQGQLHPKVLRYNRKGILQVCYHYNHGKYLKADDYSVKGKNIGEIVKINGLKIDNTHSKYMFHVDSSTVRTPTVNYTDENGLKQGRWFLRDILTDDVWGFSFREYYYTGSYKDQKKQGEWKYYHYYGKQLKSVISYENDTIHGEVVYFDREGNKSVNYEYKEGLKTGVYEVYYNSGALRIKGTLENNEFVGEYTEYKKNGKVKKYIPDTTKEHPYK